MIVLLDAVCVNALKRKIRSNTVMFSYQICKWTLSLSDDADDGDGDGNGDADG